MMIRTSYQILNVKILVRISTPMYIKKSKQLWKKIDERSRQSYERSRQSYYKLWYAVYD